MNFDITTRVIFLAIAMIGISACSTSGNLESADGGANSNSSANVVKVIPISNEAMNSGVNTNATVPANLNTGPTKNVNGMIIPANANVTIIKPKRGKPELLERPAPFDSVLTAEMNAKGEVIERRTFKRHATLLKIEKITASPNDFHFKVYLRDGKSFDLPSDAIANALTASPDEILNAAKSASSANGKSTGASTNSEKREQQ